MDIDDGVEVLVAHLLQGSSPDVAGIVNEDVDPSVVVKCRCDDCLAALRCGDRLATCDRVAARRLDLGHHLLCGNSIRASPGQGTTRVVDHDPGASGGQ